MSTVQRTVVDTHVVAFLTGLAIGSMFELVLMTGKTSLFLIVILVVIVYPHPRSFASNRLLFYLLTWAGALTAIIIMRSLPKQFRPFEGLGYLLLSLLAIYWASQSRDDAASEPLL